MSNKPHIPVKSIGKPNGGPPPPIDSVPDDKPVYSLYTGNLVVYGNIPWEHQMMHHSKTKIMEEYFM